ncbi:MAG: 3-isopropylmalate dehydratase small subunit [Verrucomicrobia bacterium]|nr:3-isopropylmalate dehydratase small subunit [Verrucomicrobiota bacterium]
MDRFETYTGVVGTLDRANVDTDQIIPKQFLKSIKRTGFGESLFFDWRYNEVGKPDQDFELNAPAFAGASVLVTRNNFGCGSSREHAVWAIAQYGFRTVIAPWAQRGDVRVPAFADIFRNNCVKNGVLTIELSSAEVDEIFSAVNASPGLKATVNLEAQTIALESGKSFSFEVDPGVKETLLKGLDDIAQTLEHESDISAFEATHNTQLG